jgi:hypothetical protein
MLTNVPLCGLLVEQGFWRWRRRQQAQVERPQVSADDLHNHRTLFSRERLAKVDANLKFSRKLPQLDQYSYLLPQQKLQTLEMKVLRPRSIIDCIRNTDRRYEESDRYEESCVRSGFALLVRSRFSRVDFSVRLRP